MVVVSERTKKEISLGQDHIRKATGLRRYEQAKAAGRCTTCRAPTEGDHIRCNDCRNKYAHHNIARRAKPVPVGYCYECHHRRSALGKAKCEHCQALSNASVRRLNRKRRMLGLCRSCSQPVSRFGMCLRCRAIKEARRRAWRLRIKEELRNGDSVTKV